MEPERRFAALVDALAHEPGVSLPGEPGHRGFGADALKVNGSIFAMLVKGALVLKLPAGRVADLVGSGAATPFANGAGRAMREWAVLTDAGNDLGLAREALAHVRSRSSRP